MPSKTGLRSRPPVAAAPQPLRARFAAFVLEAYPLLADRLITAFDAHATDETLEAVLQLVTTMPDAAVVPNHLETQPLVQAPLRIAHAQQQLRGDLEAFRRREAIRASITPDEMREMLNGIILTRAVDNKMKQLFLSSEMKYTRHNGPELGFQGKGFRSLGQEAIYASALRLKRGATFADGDAWRGDVIAPLIRDLGVVLAFHDDVTSCLNAQVGKAGSPTNGADLHVGFPTRGVRLAAAPLTIATCTVVGDALAFKLRNEARVAVSYIGEGGSSLGEWHEAINFAAALQLPMVFCIENNQTALSTPRDAQSKARTFADKAVGYGMPHVTVDGCDPEAIAAAFAWAAERARKGLGPALIETVAMRMCGHAHHDDMLYLGAEPALGFAIPALPADGYVDRAKYDAFRARDPLACYAATLTERGVINAHDVEAMKTAAVARVDAAAQELRARPWPTPSPRPVFVRRPVVAEVEPAPAFDRSGNTYLDGIARGLDDVLRKIPEAFVLGEDVGAPYGNAFLLLKPLLEAHSARIFNTPIAEGAIIGACVGAALAGMRPIGEMQFNDFVASGFNQLVNNAAKTRARGGTPVPMTLRMPWGGLRRAGPYHSQDTAPWFYRTAGLKIVAPSTPHDARALLMSAVLDDDPVLFYEHIGLYREPKIKQRLEGVPTPIPLGTAAFRRLGQDMTFIAYGAYVHKALAAAETLAAEGYSCDVLDLRSLAPIDWDRVFLTVERTGKVLLVGEDSVTGSILESVAARIAEHCFEHLDAPVRVRGAQDQPVPYAPSLEDSHLLSDEDVLDEARALLVW